MAHTTEYPEATEYNDSKATACSWHALICHHAHVAIWDDNPSDLDRQCAEMLLFVRESLLAKEYGEKLLLQCHLIVLEDK